MSYYRRDCLSIKSNKILANLFAQLILLSEKVQSFRQIIASVPYYDCVQLFRVLDNEEKGFLTVKDFGRLIGETHKKVVAYAFSWFDQAKLGEISRLEFIAFLMPRRNQDLRQMVARRIEQPSPDQNFSSTINQQLRIFTQLLNQMISHELKIIEQRKLLLKQDDYSLKGVLNSLDVHVHDFVSTNDILKFLRNYAIQATRQQLKDFLEILDSKLQGKITLEQLKWMVEGLENTNGEYRQIIRNSSKKRAQSTKRQSRTKIIQKQPQELVQEIKQFVRNPSRPKHQNIESRPQNQQLSKISKLLNSQSNFHQTIKSQNHEQTPKYSSSKKQAQNQSVKKRDELLQKSGYKQEDNQFQRILKKYRQAQAEAIKKDAQLIIAQQEVKERLKEEFNQRSNQRRRAITESHSLISQSQRRNVGQTLTKDHIRDSIKQQNYGRQSLDQKRSQPLPTHHYENPYASKYDKKINTIVDNFYRRNNNQTAPLHFSQKRHGTASSSFYDRLGDISYGTVSHDRYSTRRKFLEDQLQREKQRNRVRPFDQRQNYVKQQINKKLGDDIYNIKLPSRAYDALAHQARQRPLQESIKRMKQSSDRIDQQRLRMAPSTGMAQNISIISKQRTKKAEESGKKASQAKQMSVFRTEVKQNPVSTPSSVYQSVYNGDSKSRGQRTTQTKYPYAQSENKMTPSLLRIEQENSLHQ